ncbi:MAG TPA: SDR family oxidoreductase [Anaeromyxobacteraceae bacterium]|nr:SDR family oxidoreductase [Anaeromyxobacteraceae bacterium]
MIGRLDGRTAIVTGGGRGIGAAVARELTARGARVTVFARTPAELDAVVASGGAALAVSGDVSSEADVVRLRAAHERVLGPCDVLVHAAGILERARVEALEPSAWRRVLDVNLTGVFLLTRAVLPGMRSRGRGRIVAISSIAGHLGTPEATAYNASKWGLIGFSKSLAEELRGSGVQVMSVSPGSVDTRMAAQTPFPPVMTPADVARVVGWLAAEAPDAMSGSDVGVFG